MDWLEILLQLPVVAVFLGYVIHNNKVWRDYLAQRNGKLEKAIEQFESTLRTVDKTLDRNNLILVRFLSKDGRHSNDIEEMMQ